MKFVVPLTIPWTRSIVAPDSDSWQHPDHRHDAGDCPFEAQLHALLRAVSHNSSPYWDSSCLLAVTTWRPLRIARSR